MKNKLILLLGLGILMLMTSCPDTKTYSQELKEEENLIADWLTRNNIVVLDEFPEDSVFAENEMYLYDNGLYFQLLSIGEVDTLRNGDTFILRYSQSTLYENPIVEDYLTTQDRPYPTEITYGSLTNSCEGWQTAFEAMKRGESRAKIIVPSQIGRNQSVVTPYFYELRIRKIPK